MSDTPDKPASQIMVAIRKAVRKIRMLIIFIRVGGRLAYGENSYIAKGWSFFIPGQGEIGKNVSIGANFICQTNFRIGDECLISSNVSFVGNDHDLYHGKSAYFSGRLPPSTVILEGNNFIGFGAIIVGDVRIGEGAIIAAGAVVINNIPPNEVYGGVPARRLKTRPQNSGFNSASNNN